MDSCNKVLDYPNMTAIPTYALYGERQTHGEHWLHWETITSRSRLYGFRIAAHRHDALYQLIYVSDGRASVVIDGEAVEVTPPAIMVLPPLSVHGFEFSSDIEGVVLTFFARDVQAALADIGEESHGLNRPGILRPVEGVVGKGQIDIAIRRLIAEVDHRAPGQEAALRAQLTLLLVALHRLDLAAARNAREEGEVSARHGRAFLALVDAHYRDTRKIGFYASRLGITPPTSTASAARSSGHRPWRHRAADRLGAALLQFSVLSVKETASCSAIPTRPISSSLQDASGKAPSAAQYDYLKIGRKQMRRELIDFSGGWVFGQNPPAPQRGGCRSPILTRRPISAPSPMKSASPPTRIEGGNRRRLEAAMANARVARNGGRSRHRSLTPFEARLTGRLRNRENILTVTVDGGENPKSALWQQIDYLTYAGLYRERGCATAPVFLGNCGRRPILAERKTVQARVEIANPQGLTLSGTLTARLLGGEAGGGGSHQGRQSKPSQDTGRA